MDLFYRKHRWSLKCKLLIQQNCFWIVMVLKTQRRKNRNKQFRQPKNGHSIIDTKLPSNVKMLQRKTTWPRLGRPRVATSIQVAGKRNWFRFFDRVQMYQWFLGRIWFHKTVVFLKMVLLLEEKKYHILYIDTFQFFARRNSYIYLNGVNGFFSINHISLSRLGRKGSNSSAPLTPDMVEEEAESDTRYNGIMGGLTHWSSLCRLKLGFRGPLAKTPWIGMIYLFLATNFSCLDMYVTVCVWYVWYVWFHTESQKGT